MPNGHQLMPFQTRDQVEAWGVGCQAVFWESVTDSVNVLR
jgi:hypothetical protein